VYVVDSSAIFMKKQYKKMVTVPEVIEEIKDEDSRLYLSLLDIKIEEASRESINRVVEVASKSGDIYKLSNTDIKLLAKALDLRNKAILSTDDYSMQNVASLLGIEVDNILQPLISKTYKWVKVCKGCGREVEEDTCQICGSETILRKFDYDK
jgi:UPF0271 protein